MWAMVDHGRPLLDDPTRLEEVTALGLDESSFLNATRLAPTRWVTGLVDLAGWPAAGLWWPTGPGPR
jgi:transposase